MIYPLRFVVPSFVGIKLHQTEMVIPLVDRVVRVLRLHDAGSLGVVVSLAFGPSCACSECSSG
jgi:hypothetical protein